MTYSITYRMNTVCKGCKKSFQPWKYKTRNIFAKRCVACYEKDVIAEGKRPP